MEFNLEKMAQEVARQALDEIEYKGKTLREWVELLSYFDGGKEKPIPPCEENEPEVLFCGICKSGEYLHNEDGARNAYCGQCGHKIDWPYYDAQVDCVETKKQQEKRLPEHLQAAYDDLVSILRGGDRG